MAKKRTQIYLRRPRDEIERALSTPPVYGMKEQVDHCCTVFAGLWNCEKIGLCIFMTAYVILLVIFGVLLFSKLFTELNLYAGLNWIVVMLPLELLVTSIAFASGVNGIFDWRRNLGDKQEVCDAKACSISCVSKVVWAIILWLIGLGLGVLVYFLDDAHCSLVKMITSGSLFHLVCSFISVAGTLGCYAPLAKG